MVTRMTESKIETRPCRSCGRPVIWATVLASGSRMPVDPEPTTPFGNVVLFLRREEGRRPTIVAKVVSEGTAPEPGEQLRRSHFASCPAAELHRQQRDDRRSERFVSGRQSKRGRRW